MNQINIEVAYATPNKQRIIPLEIGENVTVIDAISLSGIARDFPNSNLEHIDINTPIGIFGKRINVITYKLRDKDRIEIYRPLNKTPNQKRLERIK